MADIISTLPDAILCHILSFLETKQSVTTSVLSKRWNPIWRSVLALHFYFDVENTDPDYDCDFNNFVDTVLHFRDVALPIKTFRLEAPYVIPRWVDCVVHRRLEYLDLCVVNDYIISTYLPVTVLTCKTLVVLKLDCFSVDLGLSSVLLPSLKTLHLKDIWFPKLQDFMLFVTGCPILEDLFASCLSFDNEEESLTCNEWNLSNLARADIDCSFPLKAVHNVPSLRLEISQVSYYRDKNDFIPTFHNLTHLELIWGDYSLEFFIYVLNHCPKLQRLDLHEVENDNDDKPNWVLPDVVPKCLSLHLRTCNLFCFRDELMLARYILKNAGVLQTMKIWNHGQPEIKQTLASFPRASSKCELAVNDVPLIGYFGEKTVLFLLFIES